MSRTVYEVDMAAMDAARRALAGLRDILYCLETSDSAPQRDALGVLGDAVLSIEKTISDGLSEKTRNAA